MRVFGCRYDVKYLQCRLELICTETLCYGEACVRGNRCCLFLVRKALPGWEGETFKSRSELVRCR